MDWHPRPLAPLTRLPAGGAWHLDAMRGPPLTPATASTPDIAPGPAQRAAVLPPRAEVYALATACWVHVGGEPPGDLEVAGTRARHSRHDGVRHRTIRHRPSEVVTIAGRHLTTPLATACDLARYAGAAVTVREGRVAEVTERLRALLANGLSCDQLESALLQAGCSRGRLQCALQAVRSLSAEGPARRPDGPR